MRLSRLPRVARALQLTQLPSSETHGCWCSDVMPHRWLNWRPAPPAMKNGTLSFRRTLSLATSNSDDSRHRTFLCHVADTDNSTVTWYVISSLIASSVTKFIDVEYRKLKALSKLECIIVLTAWVLNKENSSFGLQSLILLSDGHKNFVIWNKNTKNKIILYLIRVCQSHEIAT